MRAGLTIIGGPGDDPKPLTPSQMKDWNSFVDYLDKKGYKGHKDLDKKETGLSRKLFDEYLKENPSAAIKYEDVKSVQMEMQRLKDAAQQFAARRGDPNASKIMSGTSNIDGWAGSKTTSFKFPDMQVKDFRNNNLVANQNLGLVGADLKPTGIAIRKQKPPTGVKLEPLYDSQGNKTGLGYTDPTTGDIVEYKE